MKPVLILISEYPDTGGRSLEAVRVAAGLAQLSDLKVHLLIQAAAVGLLNEPAAQLREYLDLLQQAGGQILVSQNGPATQRPIIRLSEEEIRRLEQSTPVRIEI